MKLQTAKNYIRYLLSFLVASCILYLAAAPPAHSFFIEPQTPKKGALKTIVIDPGHGGEDAGAVGPSGKKEKDINLEIAKLVERLILQKMDVKLILTRTDDRFVSLEKRTDIANKNNADLFISIHANASYKKRAGGVETYFLSFDASDEDARRVAAFENAAIPAAAKIGDRDKDDLKTILIDMAQTAVLNESSELAEIIQENLWRKVKGGDRGVKQAPFIVLAGAAMPAVLVEVGFISNAAEEKRLALKATQEAIAAAIVKGIIRFDNITKARMGYALERGEKR